MPNTSNGLWTTIWLWGPEQGRWYLLFTYRYPCPHSPVLTACVKCTSKARCQEQSKPFSKAFVRPHPSAVPDPALKQTYQVRSLASQKLWVEAFSSSHQPVSCWSRHNYSTQYRNTVAAGYLSTCSSKFLAVRAGHVVSKSQFNCTVKVMFLPDKFCLCWGRYRWSHTSLSWSMQFAFV